MVINVLNWIFLKILSEMKLKGLKVVGVMVMVRNSVGLSEFNEIF